VATCSAKSGNFRWYKADAEKEADLYWRLPGFAWQPPEKKDFSLWRLPMLSQILERIIQEHIQKIESLPDGSFEKERKLEGIRLFNEAREKLSNPYNDRKETDRLITHGLTLIYYEQQYQHTEV
jgi:hypothetical protein